MDLEDNLRRALKRIGASATPSADRWDSIEKRVSRAHGRLPGNRLLVIAVSLGVSIAAVGWVILAVRPVERREASGESNNSMPAVAIVHRVGPAPRTMAIDAGEIWVVVPESDLTDPCSGEIKRIDSSTNQILGQIKVNGSPVDVAAGPDSLWVLLRVGCATPDEESGATLRIDPISGAIESRTPLGTSAIPVHLAVGGSAAWVTEYVDETSSQVVRIDTATEEMVDVIQVDGDIREIDLAGDEPWLYITGGPSRSLLRIDPDTDKVESLELPRTIDAQPGFALAATSASVWVGAGDAAIEIDATNHSIKGTPIPVPGGFQPFDVDASGAWFLGYDARLGSQVIGHLVASTSQIDVTMAIEEPPLAARLDPASNRILLLQPDGTG
jgi:hypothetical protein